MKIMFALTIYEIGGVSTVARNLMDCFDMDGHDIVLLIEKLSPRHYLINNRIRLINMDIAPQSGFLAKVFNFMRHIILMRRHITREAPDVILSIGAFINCNSLFSLLFYLNKRPKIIIDEQSEEMFLKTKPKNIKTFFLKAMYKILMFCLYCQSDYIVATSKSIASSIKRLLFVSPHKVKVIYNFVDSNKIRELCKEKDLPQDFNSALPFIGTVSRLAPEKGVHFLIQGFKSLLDKVDARLIIVGDGVEKSRLEQMAKELGIKEKVFFTGLADNPFKYIKKMDVFILPSLWEGFPNVLLEAMTCGVPVIASDSVGGISEVIQNKKNGLLVKPGSSLAISEAVYYLLSNKERRERIIEEASKSVKQFDSSIIKKQYESLIFS